MQPHAELESQAQRVTRAMQAWLAQTKSGGDSEEREQQRRTLWDSYRFEDAELQRLASRALAHRSGYGFFWESFQQAVATMMGPGPQRQRLEYAAEILGRLHDEEIPDTEIQTRYRELMTTLTSRQAPEGFGKDAYRLTAAEMSERELRKAAEEILHLYDWVVRANAPTNHSHSTLIPIRSD